jgi:hypothetical protein
MRERHAIYEKRTAGLPAPWTKDPILSQYRFCNVYRELDKVTIWIAKNYRAKSTPWDMPFAMYVARMINRIETMELLGLPRPTKAWLAHAAKVLNELDDSGLQVYGAAYIMTAGGRPGRKIDFTLECFEDVAEHYQSFRCGMGGSVDNIWSKLLGWPGCGRFIAYEIATDLRHTLVYDQGLSHLSWANPGPGAVRGINRLLGLPFRQRHAPIEAYIDAISILTELANAENRLAHMLRFEARDIEHSLCETDKYLRALNGDGKPKQRFQPS